MNKSAYVLFIQKHIKSKYTLNNNNTHKPNKQSIDKHKQTDYNN